MGQAGTLAEAISRPLKKARVLKCDYCGREFVRIKTSTGGGHRKYCYDPHCERSRQNEVNRLGRERAKQKRKESQHD